MSRSPDRGLYWLLHVTGKALSRITSGLSARSDQATVGRLADDLRQDIEIGWAPLLEAHHGAVRDALRPNQRTHFDYATCLVEFADIEMQVSRGRHEVRVQVRRKPDGVWEELPALLAQYGVREGLDAQDSVIVYGNAVQSHWEIVAQRLA